MKSFTSLEQSKKLAECLSHESADMCFYTRNNMPPLMTPYSRFKEFYVEPTPAFLIPCWSLAALLNVINKTYFVTLLHDGIMWNILVIHHDIDKCNHTIHADSPVDACYKMILKLNELKML